MQKSKKNLIIVSLFALFFIALVPAAIAVGINIKYQGTSFPGVSLAGTSYTGLSRSEAQKSLEAAIQEKYKDGMSITYKNKTYKVALSDLGIQIDTAKSINKVFSYGHRQNLYASTGEQINLMLMSGNIDFDYELVDKGYLVEKSKWQEIAKFENPARNFSYKFDGKNFVPTAATEGFIINQAKLKEDIEENLANLRNDSINISTIEDKLKVLQDQDGTALNQAKILAKKQVILKYNSNLWTVAGEDFGKWIGFVPQKNSSGKYALALAPNNGEIITYLATLIPQINQQPVNAQMEFKDGKVSVFALSQEGIQVDTEKSTEKIGKDIFKPANYVEYPDSADNTNAGTQTKTQAQAKTISNNQDAGTVQNPNQISIELTVSKIAPELTIDKIDNMGITSLLATGESDFKGSSKSRVHNITTGASKFNGILIGPGDTFSFDKILGNVGPKEGFLPEYVIKKGQTVPEYGGGLCQVSTTAFRGAVNAGLEVTQRTNHAYAVQYYAPQGTDATIYPPNPDLVFINNTPAYILIQTRISGTKLYFDFYGTNDGRKVETEGPVVYEQGSGGAMKTWWKQRVYDKDGKLFLEKTFYSNYKSPALYPHTNPLT